MIRNQDMNSGHDGYRMSKRASEAYRNGEKPLSRWTKKEIVSLSGDERMAGYPLSVLRKYFLCQSSWHHTSRYANKTDFFAISEDAIRNIDINELDRLAEEDRKQRQASAMEKQISQRLSKRLCVGEKIMTKLNFDNLIIEVTRKCNMHCAHCMRGEAENKDLNLDRFASFLKDVASINSITFTGGEPTLNVDAINFVLHMCKALEIPVYEFYIVTNGKEITSKFLNAMIDWYVYCIECGGEPEMCGVALSQDQFHDQIDPENVAKLRALSFYRPDDKKTRSWKNGGLIDLGRARGLVSDPKRDPMRYPPEVDLHDDNIYTTDSTITFTVDGELLFDCDYEYESTDDIKACDWNNAVEMFTRMATDPNYTFPV